MYTIKNTFTGLSMLHFNDWCKIYLKRNEETSMTLVLGVQNQFSSAIASTMNYVCTNQ